MVVMINKDADMKLKATKIKQLKMIVWEEAIHAVAEGVSWR